MSTKRFVQEYDNTILKITQNWKQHMCSSISKWVNKLCSIDVMKHYSETRTNEIMIHTITWMNLKTTMLSEKKKLYTKKYTLYNSIYVMFYNRQNYFIMKKVTRVIACRGWRWGMAGKRQEGTFWSESNVLHLDRSLGQNSENGVLKVWTYINFTWKGNRNQ